MSSKIRKRHAVKSGKNTKYIFDSNRSISSIASEVYLFGLTNPRTGKYYEFNHWTESVQAYYTKVQYKYNGGNYLLWLEDIGYAEDPKYIIAVENVLRGL